jgi:hypothetical protein
MTVSAATERSLSGLADDEMDRFGDGVTGWLIELRYRFGALTR